MKSASLFRAYSKTLVHFIQGYDQDKLLLLSPPVHAFLREDRLRNILNEIVNGLKLRKFY
jgi:hypothetical protein